MTLLFFWGVLLSVFVQMPGWDIAEAPVVGASFDVVGNLLVALLIFDDNSMQMEKGRQSGGLSVGRHGMKATGSPGAGCRLWAEPGVRP